MDHIRLLMDLHRHAERQGPGGEAESRLAMRLAGLDPSRHLKIADIGCGTGAASILLARELDAHVTAVDFLPEFLDELRARAHSQGVADKITACACSMDALPFADAHFDVVWSEGAIYNMGFEAGVSAWRRVLKPGGMLVISEITWLGATRPHEVQAHWEREYPQIDVASAKIAILERHGYSPRGYFVLPAYCWTEHYYRPMQRRFHAFLDRHGRSDAARAVVEAEKTEIAMYDAHGEHYGYGVYIAKSIGRQSLPRPT